MTLSLRKEIKELSQDKMRKAQNNNDTRNRGQWRRSNVEGKKRGMDKG